MDYGNTSVGSLFRGPVLHTPQGWVCIATTIAYLLLAVGVQVFALPIAVGKTPATTVVLSLFWPLITFLFYVKNNAPSFKASWSQTAYLFVVAIAPIGYSYWKSHAP